MILKQFSGVKVPLSILGAEIDRMSPPELVKQFEAILNAKPEVRDSIFKFLQFHIILDGNLGHPSMKNMIKGADDNLPNTIDNILSLSLSLSRSIAS